MHYIHDIFDDLGCLPGEVKLHVNESVTPVVHPPRKIPHSLLKRLKSEIDRMLSLDVVRWVQEPTDWVSSFVISEKSDGQILFFFNPNMM